METIDYKAQLRKFYKPASPEAELVDLPSMNFIMIDGQGHPDTSREYQEAGDALLAVANGIKALIKKAEALEYGVMPLESLWGSEDPARFSVERKADWKWTLMIMQPDRVTKKVYEKARDEVRAKQDWPALAGIRYAGFQEGRCAQSLHVGPLSEEGPAIRRVHARIEAINARFTGKHHEIYLSDMRKAAPEKARTIIRQPYL